MSRRTEQARRWFGPAGPEALHPAFKPEPAVLEFYGRAAQEWLDMEVPGVTVKIREPNELRLGAEYRLRLAPEACRWILLERRGRAWRLLRPSKACLALTDWLAQVRRRLTTSL